MTDVWYYAEGEEARGPLSLGELLAVLARVADARRVMIWGHGFESWKPVEDVNEVAQQLFRPPPLQTTNALPSPVGEVVADAAAFQVVRPELTGIRGWLVVVAIGQVLGLLKSLVSLGQYYSTMNGQLWKRFPEAFWGEAAMNVVSVGVILYTIVLFFRRSRLFPRFFIFQMIGFIFLPLIDLFWVASMIALVTNAPVSKYLLLEERDIGAVAASVLAAAIWIPYILCSRRVANTFTD
jgi:Protein of unknown function (DUF2569)/GYF domain 2